MSRWLVGSSSSSRSGSPASARASDARVSSPPGEGRQRAVELLGRRSRARAAGPARGCANPSRRRARGDPARASSGRGACRRPAARPSRPRAAGAPPRARRGSCTPTGRSRAASGRARAAGAGRGARPACPSRRRARRRRCRSRPTTIRRSVVLPAPLRPASVMRSPRSSLNDTPRNSGEPAMSLSRALAITTAIAAFKARARRLGVKFARQGCRMKVSGTCSGTSPM